MNIFSIKNTRVSQRILLLFQFMSIPVVILFITFLVTIHLIHRYETKIFSENIASIRAAYNVETSILSMKGLTAYYILERDPRWNDTFETNVNKFNHWYTHAFTNSKTENERTVLSSIALDFHAFQKQHREILELLDSGNEQKAEDLLLKVSNPYFNDIYNGCEKLIRANDRMINSSLQNMEKYTLWARIFVYTLSLCFILIGILLSVIITRSIVKPLHEIEKNSRNLGSESRSRDEVERLKHTFDAVITAMKQNQDQVIRSEKRAAIGELAAGLSHELNNPIGIIAGFSEMLLATKSLKKKDRQIVQDIHRESLRCRNLLGEFLAFARSPEPVLRKLNMARVIRQNVRLFSRQNKYRQITFNYERFEPGLRAMVDPLQMTQVFINLFMNACDAMNEKGIITISMFRDSGITVKVRDTGPGIKEETIGMIFTPFYSTKARGTGLGLSVCRGIVEKHGGSIGVQSRPGEYTEFIINLPEADNGTISASSSRR